MTVLPQSRPLTYGDLARGIVARRSDATPKNLPAAPVLAVEVLSPSTRLYDLTLK